MTVFDFSFSRPSIDDLKAAGAVGVARYLSSYTTPKNADAEEVAAYWAAGIAVLLVWENDTHDTDGGYGPGANAGHRARAMANGLGFPVDHVIYWASDRRLNATTRAEAIEYGRGFRDAAGRCRVYGEGALIDACVADGQCDGGWMPDTWGPCNHVKLLQRTTPSALAGTDHNDPKSDDWGGYLPGQPEGDDMNAQQLRDAIANNEAGLRDVLAGLLKEQVLSIVHSEGISGGGDPAHNGVAAGTSAVLAALKTIPGAAAVDAKALADEFAKRLTN